ncbi:MAG: TlpA family protein disulfide reductase [Lachnospiraceae bacterium]|jgi:thiol-disulfide isomerase/thioredoxin|nr:TlpA family protein disulfide reductase [Lachnospiraceae bacterium]MCI1726989.1 TlpA family protein disulfide reductase [Lachnospiraceae bacterium]
MFRKAILPLALAGALLMTACGAASPAGNSTVSLNKVPDSSVSSVSADSAAAASETDVMTSKVGGSSKTPDTNSGMEAASGTVSKGNAGFGVLDSFSTEDLAGNAADQSILKKAKLTMINVWGTFCSPCINELPELSKLNAEYADRGFQVIGIPLDTISYDGSIDSAQKEKAAQIVEQVGADYTHLLPEGNLLKIAQQVIYYPTTMFVDENGNQVGDVFVGAKSKDGWAAVIEEYLK